MEKKYLEARKKKGCGDSMDNVENFYDIIEAAGNIKPDVKVLWG